MRGDWLRRAAAGTAALLACCSLLNPAVPATADPLDDARTKLMVLEEQASELGERFDAAQDAADEQAQRVSMAEADVASTQAKVDSLSTQAQQLALAEFRGRELDAAQQVALAGDPEAFLDRLSTADHTRQVMDAQLTELQVAQAGLTDALRTQQAAAAQLESDRQQAADLKASLDAKVTAAAKLVQQLTVDEFEKLNDGVKLDVDRFDLAGASPKAAKAVRFALKQVGKPYVWAQAGPDSYDCSGLTLAAYDSAGIALPHFSGAQAKLGAAVEIGKLRPGDLLFWYSPVHHVSMYLGHGLMVHARNPRVGVLIERVASFDAPFAGARRITTG